MPERNETLTDRPEAAALKVLRGYASVGLGLAILLGLSAFLLHDRSAGRAVCLTGAMAGLFGAAAGLNLTDRIRRRKSAHVYFFAGILAVVAAALVGVSVMALEQGLEGAWSPLAGAGYLLVLAVICWRMASEIRSSAARRESSAGAKRGATRSTESAEESEPTGNGDSAQSNRRE